MEISEGLKFTLSNCTGTRDDLIFVGWSYNNSVYQAGQTVVKVGGIMKFTAVWTFNENKAVSVKRNGATVSAPLYLTQASRE